MDTPLETTWDEVHHAALGVTLPEPRDRRHGVTTRPVAMEDKIELILGSLREAAQIEFSRLLTGLQGLGAKMHGVMTFLASLELTRRRRLFLRQVSPFSELWLYRREAADDDDAPPTDEAPQDDGSPQTDELRSTDEPRPTNELAVHDPVPNEAEEP